MTSFIERESLKYLIEHEDICVSCAPSEGDGSCTPTPIGGPLPVNTCATDEHLKTRTNGSNVYSINPCPRWILSNKLILAVTVAVVMTMIVSVVITVVVLNEASEIYTGKY